MGIVPEGDRKCENSGQVGTGPIWHPEVRNRSEGQFLRRHEVGGRVRIRVPPEQAADHRDGLRAHCVTGSCWNITYEGQSVIVTVVDRAGDGFTLTKQALDKLTCVDS